MTKRIERLRNQYDKYLQVLELVLDELAKGYGHVVWHWSFEDDKLHLTVKGEPPLPFLTIERQKDRIAVIDPTSAKISERGPYVWRPASLHDSLTNEFNARSVLLCLDGRLEETLLRNRDIWNMDSFMAHTLNRACIGDLK